MLTVALQDVYIAVLQEAEYTSWVPVAYIAVRQVEYRFALPEEQDASPGAYTFFVLAAYKSVSLAEAYQHLQAVSTFSLEESKLLPEATLHCQTVHSSCLACNYAVTSFDWRSAKHSVLQVQREVSKFFAHPGGLYC